MNDNWNLELCHSLRRRIGRAVSRYAMIADGDRILIGLSGGKDSLLLLHALSELRRRSPIKFEIAACTAGMTGMDLSHLRDYCACREVEYIELELPVIEIIESRGERSPCSFCANMRRGLLCSWASEHGFGKLALGHTVDDAAETFFMNILRAGRAKSFLPSVLMSRAGVTVIRPLCGCTEAAIIDEVKRLELPVLQTVCPFAGHTERQRIRELIASLRSDIPDLYGKVTNALENLSGDDAWRIRACDNEGVSK